MRCLFNMLPRSSLYYTFKAPFADAIAKGKLSTCNRTSWVKSYNFFYLIFCKNSLGIFTPEIMWRFGSSLFGSHVLKVVSLCSKKQVFWVGTFWVITTMEALEIVGNRTIVQFIGKTMSEYVSWFGMLRQEKNTITTGVNCTKPPPTVISGYFNFRPETLLGCTNEVIMTIDEAMWLSLYPTITFRGALSNWCFLTTSAVTKAIRYARMRLHSESPFQIRGVLPRAASTVPGLSIG